MAVTFVVNGPAPSAGSTSGNAAPSGEFSNRLIQGEAPPRPPEPMPDGTEIRLGAVHGGAGAIDPDLPSYKPRELESPGQAGFSPGSMGDPGIVPNPSAILQAQQLPNVTITETSTGHFEVTGLTKKPLRFNSQARMEAYLQKRLEMAGAGGNVSVAGGNQKGGGDLTGWRPLLPGVDLPPSEFVPPHGSGRGKKEPQEKA